MARRDYLPDAETQLQSIRARSRKAREVRLHREKQASDEEDSFGLFSMLGPLVLAPAIALGLYLAYLAPSNPFEKGDALLEGGDAEGAERIFARAVAQQPLFAYAHIKLGITLVAQERRLEALDRFQTALELGGADRMARKLMSRTALRVAEEALDASPEDARVLLNRALEASPEDSDVHASLGVTWQRTGDTRRAIDAMSTAIELDPAQAHYHFDRALLMLSVGGTQEAARSLDVAAHLRPTHLPSHVLRRALSPRADLSATTRLSAAIAAGAAGGASSAESVYGADHWALLGANLVAAADDQAGHAIAHEDEAHSTRPLRGLSAAAMRRLRARGWVVIDGVLGAAELSKLQRAPKELGHVMGAGHVGLVGSADLDSAPAERPDTRRDRVVRLPIAEPARWQRGMRLSETLISGLSSLHRLFIRQLHRQLLPVWPADRPPLFPRESMQYACYEHGAFYRAHEDRPRPPESPAGADATGRAAHEAERAWGGSSRDRAYTAIYYTNLEMHRGGELRLWPDGAYAAELIKPIGDRLVVFDSALLHEVLPNDDSTPRCAFTMWYASSSL